MRGSVTKPSFYLGGIKIVDASQRGMPPDQFCKISYIVFAGRAVFDEILAQK